ncbi:MAG: hypothetical protein HKN47_16660 [Pirellulaceae bacterium]|nr:hypothetical protein [Pirellulaceae bacterium]
MKYPITPDGRYFLHRGRLWRCTNPHLDEAVRQALVTELMRARRDVGAALQADSSAALSCARERVQESKLALGERGPTWWQGAPDYNRYLAKNTPYRQWADQIQSDKQPDR